MADPTENAFANVVARKLERDRLAAEKESADVRRAREIEAKWQSDRAKFTSDLAIIKEIISKHSGSLAIGQLRLNAASEGFDEEDRSDRISVHVSEDGRKTKYHVNFNLRSGSVNPVIIIGYSGNNPSPVPVYSATAQWYEAAILSMMEQAYPAPKP